MKKSLFAFALSLCLVAPALAEETAQAPAATDSAKPAKKAKPVKADPGTPVAAADAKADAPKDEAKPAKGKKGKPKKTEEKKDAAATP